MEFVLKIVLLVLVSGASYASGNASKPRWTVGCVNQVKKVFLKSYTEDKMFRLVQDRMYNGRYETEGATKDAREACEGFQKRILASQWNSMGDVETEGCWYATFYGVQDLPDAKRKEVYVKACGAKPGDQWERRLTGR